MSRHHNNRHDDDKNEIVESKFNMDMLKIMHMTTKIPGKRKLQLNLKIKILKTKLHALMCMKANLELFINMNVTARVSMCIFLCFKFLHIDLQRRQNTLRNKKAHQSPSRVHSRKTGFLF